MFRQLFFIFQILFISQAYCTSQINTDCLCVLYDAGETNSLSLLLKKWEEENRDFRVLVMGTAENLIKPDMFIGKRLTLQDLNIEERIDNRTPRTTGLSETALSRLHKINPRMVLVGTASKIQEQVLNEFEESITYAFLDNFNYDPKSEFYQTVYKVQAAAQHVLCPSQNVLDMFHSDNAQYHVVGKPSLDLWEEAIEKVNREEILQILGLSNDGGPIVAFVGGYGPGYEIINPLFQECAEKLQQDGYQVVILSHPKIAPQKVKITEILAVAHHVVGYNSSVMFEAALIGKNAFFMIPKEIPYRHFAIDKGYMGVVSNYDELLLYLRSKRVPVNIREILSIPSNSIQIIEKTIEKQWEHQLLDEGSYAQGKCAPLFQ